MTRKERQGEDGFSLLELSFVLLIIGLIAAGVSKGQQLVEEAKLKAVLSQINKFRLATNMFYERYGSLPGNYSEASSYLRQGLENGSGNGCINGNGLDGESLNFWKHLVAAELISLPQLVKGVPQSPIGGVLTVVYQPDDSMPGHWFLLGDIKEGKANGGLLTPRQAMSLNKSADDGSPSTGQIRSLDGEGMQGKCVLEGRYASGNEKSCVLYFQM